jgi:divalent metal cation (Fe/Co/Zn/Cd) transporter
MGPLVNLPTGATLVASTSAYSAPFFDTLLPIGLAIAGIIVGAAVVWLLMHGITGAFHGLLDRMGKSRYDN